MPEMAGLGGWFCRWLWSSRGALKLVDLCQAAQWWQVERLNVQLAKYSYQQFRHLFLEAFAQVMAARAAKLNAQHTYLETDVYSWRDQFLSSVLPSLTPLSSKKELLELFLKALPVQWVSNIRSYKPRDWEEAYSLARMLDHLLRNKNRGLCPLPQQLEQWREMRRLAFQTQKTREQVRLYGPQAGQKQPVNSIPGVPTVTAGSTSAGPVGSVPMPFGGAAYAGTLGTQPRPVLAGSGPRDPRVRVSQGATKMWPPQGPPLPGQGQAMSGQQMTGWAVKPGQVNPNQGTNQAQGKALQPVLAVPRNVDPQLGAVLTKLLQETPGVAKLPPTTPQTGPVGVGPMIARMAQGNNRPEDQQSSPEGQRSTGAGPQGQTSVTPGLRASMNTTAERLATAFPELDAVQEPRHVPLRIPVPEQGGYWESYSDVDDGPTPDGYLPSVPESLGGSGNGSQVSLHGGSVHRSHEGSAQQSQIGSGTESQVGSGAGTGSQGRSSAGSLGSAGGTPSDQS